MMYVYRILKSLELDVEVPIVLEIHNKGAVDVANSVGGRARHMEVQMQFLCELKEQGLLIVKHISVEDIEEDVFAKNKNKNTAPSSLFLEHIPDPYNCGCGWVHGGQRQRLMFTHYYYVI